MLSSSSFSAFLSSDSSSSPSSSAENAVLPFQATGTNADVDKLPDEQLELTIKYSGSKTPSEPIVTDEALITCGITKEIFNDPVTMHGHIFERAAAIRFTEQHPYTREIFDKNDKASLRTNFTMKAIVESYLQAHPEARSRQYQYLADEPSIPSQVGGANPTQRVNIPQPPNNQAIVQRQAEPESCCDFDNDCNNNVSNLGYKVARVGTRMAGIGLFAGCAGGFMYIVVPCETALMSPCCLPMFIGAGAGASLGVTTVLAGGSIAAIGATRSQYHRFFNANRQNQPTYAVLPGSPPVEHHGSAHDERQPARPRVYGQG